MDKYLYNGIELPALPEWDKIKYPYVVIVQFDVNVSGLSYALRCSASPSVYNYPNTEPIGVTPAPSITYQPTDINEGWGDATENIDDIKWQYGFAIKQTAVWSNHYLQNTDGEVTFSASYPIDAETGEEIHDYEIGNTEPETPTTRTEWQKQDAYKPNTEWNGKTFYRVMGGKWVKQDVVVPSVVEDEPPKS